MERGCGVAAGDGFLCFCYLSFLFYIDFNFVRCLFLIFCIKRQETRWGVIWKAFCGGHTPCKERKQWYGERTGFWLWCGNLINLIVFIVGFAFLSLFDLRKRYQMDWMWDFDVKDGGKCVVPRMAVRKMTKWLNLLETWGDYDFFFAR